MLAMVWPIRYPMPAPAPMVPAPAAMPTPVAFPCSNASTTFATSITTVASIPTPPFFRSTDDKLLRERLPAPLLLFFCLLLLPRVQRQLYVDLREYSEYVSLYYRDKDLKRVDHHRHGHVDDRQGGIEEQDKAEEDEDDQVPRQDVGVEPHPQRQRLGDELLEGLDNEHERGHDRLGRHIRGHEATEVRSHAV